MAKRRTPVKNRIKLKWIDEFKRFILRGNVMDLAVGVIIGGAFNKIVTSLVNDVVMPVLSLIVGNESMDSRFLALDGHKYETIESAGTVPLLKYGSFLSTVLDFLLMGIVIFFLVKALNFFHTKIKRKDKNAEAPKEPTEKECPYCFSTIKIKAVICPFCRSELSIPQSSETGETLSQT